MATKTEWIPVDDGDINTWVSAENNGRHIGVYVDDDRYAEEDLPEGYALCRLVTVEVPDAPVVAVPDWSTAPTWAMWWAMDEDGGAYWYEKQPELEDEAWNNIHGSNWEQVVIDNPNWQNSLQARPQPPQEPPQEPTR